MPILPLLQLVPAGPGSQTLTLVNDTAATGYRLMQPADWGNAAWEQAFSGPRGTLGAKVASQTPQNRILNLPVRVLGTTKADLLTKVSVLCESVDELRRYGGRITWKSTGATYRTHFDVLSAAHGVSNWDNKAEALNELVVTVRAICAPYADGDPLDILDTFASDTITAGDYVADAGALGDVAVAGGVLDAAANLGVQKRLTHVGVGYAYGDHQATVKAVPGGTISSAVFGVVLKRISATDCIVVYVDDNGANSRLRIDKIVAGTPTNLASTNLAARISAGTPLWVRGRIEGNVVYAAHYLTPPNPYTAPTTSTSFTMTSAEVPLFGRTRTGRAGLLFTPQHTDAYLKNFEVWPFTWGNGDNRISFPAQLMLAGQVPGDAPAKAELHIAADGGTNIEWVLAAWQRPLMPHNLCWEGDFERYIGVTAAWSVAAVTGVTGAATSKSQTTTAARCKYGDAAMQIVTPATANTGASFQIFHRFRRGRTYMAMLWASAASATTNTRLRLGQNGDIASETPAALSATPTLRVVSWTPSADRDVAYVAFEVTAATATTMAVDAVCVFEAEPAHLQSAIATAGATGLTVRENPAMLPPAPFLALIDTEIVQVTAVSGTTWTIGRGAERTTATTHAQDAAVTVLPPLPHLAGAGALPPIGPVSSAADGTVSPTDDNTASANYYVGYGKQKANPAAINTRIWIDPSLVDWGASDDAVPVEVWARVLIPNTASGAPVAIGSHGTPWMVEANTLEHGGAGRTTPLPGGGSPTYRMVRVGTMMLTRQVRQLVGMTWSASGTGTFAIDYLFLVPAGARIAAASGVDDTETHDPIIRGDAAFGAMWKVFASDLAGSHIDLVGSGQREYPPRLRSAGIGGSLLEISPGPVVLAADLSAKRADPSNATTQSDELSVSAVVHLSITPRWAVVRDA